MTANFQEADLHFWLAGLYRGGIPGAMKIYRDWPEVSSTDETPYHQKNLTV